MTQPNEGKGLIAQSAVVPNTPRLISGHLVFLGLAALSVALFSPQFLQLWKSATSDDRYSHIIVVPFIVAGLLYLDQKRIFHNLQYVPKLGIVILACAALLQLGIARALAPSSALSTSILAFVLACTGTFALCYGPKALQSARFPIAFLVLMVPLPVTLVDHLSYALQVASADMSHVLFRVVGIPVFRDGFTFTLPGQTIEIAEECSGIRSATAFFITGLLLAYLFLRSGWRRLVFVVAAVLISIFKNGVRIVFLSSSGRYLGVDLLHSSLHHQYGGTVFSVIALVILVPVLLMLRRGDKPAVPGLSRATVTGA